MRLKIGQGKDVLSACRETGATDKSYYRWRREYGGMKVDQAKRLKHLE
jgi:putative transposase